MVPDTDVPAHPAASSRWKGWWTRGLLLLVSAATLGAGETPPESERVGDLGGEERLVFEGNPTFSRDSVLSVLGVRLEFHAQSQPSAPLADYLAWIEQAVLRGYQNAGFAKAGVTVKADRAAQRIRVNVAEGPRFTCGEVKISGLDPALAEQLTARLRQAAIVLEPPKDVGLAGFDWPWIEGQHVRADPASVAALERSVLAALAELNRHRAEVHLELALADDRKQADLLIQVQKPGVVGALDQIEVTGLRVNSRDDLLTFLQLRPGMALAGNVVNDSVRRLYDSGRFRAHEARLSPLTEPGRFKLDLAVVEYTNAPALKQALTVEERACLKLREWIMDWPNRPEDWVVELEGTRNGRRASAELVLGQGGLAFVAREGHPTNQTSLSHALVAAPGLLGFYSGPQQAKLVGKPGGDSLKTSFGLSSEPRERTDGREFSMRFGWGIGGASEEGAPFALRFDLAPVTFVAMAHPRESVCRVEQGALSISSRADPEEVFELTADAASGRLIRLSYSVTSASPPDGLALVLRSEEGELARALREIAAGSATYTNALDPQHAWSSSLAFLGRKLQVVLEKEFPEILEEIGRRFPGGLTPEEALGTLATLERLPWGELLAPLDLSTSATPPADDREAFPLVLDGPLPAAAAGDDWVRLFGGLFLRANDAFWPRGSWPWAVSREATFLAAGTARWVTNDLTELAQAEGIGPLGCLAAAHTFSRFDPRLAVPFVRRGAKETTAAAFQADLRVLLRGEKAGQQFLRGTLQRAPDLKEQDLRVFMKLLGTNNLPLILEAFSALTTSSNQPPDEALSAVVERHWEKSLRPRLLTAFAEGCLTQFQTAEGRDPSLAAEVAGWLQAAVEQGHAPAQMLLAQLYRHGVGVTADPAAAAALIRKAAGQNYPHAACELARAYVHGAGVPQNLEEAARWFRREAEGGCTSAMVGLAQALMTRDGASRADRDEAIRWLRQAAEMKSVEAQGHLGELYEKQGDMDGALRWYREAARSGSLRAQMRLGDLLSDGMSTTPDYVEAWVWFTQAAQQGDRIGGLEARRIERKLTSEQLEGAKQRLRELSSQTAGEGWFDIPKMLGPVINPLPK